MGSGLLRFFGRQKSKNERLEANLHLLIFWFEDLLNIRTPVQITCGRLPLRMEQFIRNIITPQSRFE